MKFKKGFLSVGRFSQDSKLVIRKDCEYPGSDQLNSGKFPGFYKKAVAIVCVLAMIFTLMPINVSAASTKQKALKAYNKLLSQSKINWKNGKKVKSSDCSFAIAYIDNNNVPELLVQNKVPDYHQQGLYNLYTYRNGKVIRICSAMDSVYYYKKTGVIVTIDVSGGTITRIWKLNNFFCKEQLQKAIVNKTYYYDIVKGRSISKKEYQIKLKNLNKGKKSTKGKFYKNTAKNRQKVLK